MEFDLKSMKQRAKALMKSAKPSPIATGILFCLFMLSYVVVIVISAMYDDNHVFLYLLITEILYLNIRNSRRIYCLKIAREEQTSIGDVFSAFKSNCIGMLLLGIIKDVFYFIGLCLFIIGLIFPFYWFRFSVFAMYDEKVNPFKALEKSKKLLKGHYMELLKIDISNLGWYVLTVFLAGLPGFYVLPYTNILYAEFYEHLKAQKEIFG